MSLDARARETLIKSLKKIRSLKAQVSELEASLESERAAHKASSMDQSFIGCRLLEHLPGRGGPAVGKILDFDHESGKWRVEYEDGVILLQAPSVVEQAIQRFKKQEDAQGARNAPKRPNSPDASSAEQQSVKKARPVGQATGLPTSCPGPSTSHEMTQTTAHARSSATSSAGTWTAAAAMAGPSTVGAVGGASTGGESRGKDTEGDVREEAVISQEGTSSPMIALQPKPPSRFSALMISSNACTASFASPATSSATDDGGGAGEERDLDDDTPGQMTELARLQSQLQGLRRERDAALARAEMLDPMVAPLENMRSV